MTSHAEARTAYGRAGTRSGRDSEYALFARVTHALGALDEADRGGFGRLAQAVSDNQRLWGALAVDLADDGNGLPPDLRGRLLSLAGFVRRHSMAVLGGRASVGPLIEVNTAIMKGLRGDLAVGR